MSSHIVWTTVSVNETIQKLRQGSNVDLGCFYDRNPELKAANILFQLTHEEEKEFIKCSSDITHFVETYCRFMTDKGRDLVTLRDFQREILDTLGEEIWLDFLDDVGPVVRNFILMASRQTGKCQLFNAQIVIRNTLTNSLTTLTIGDLYNIVNKNFNRSLKQQLIFKLKSLIYKLYIKLS